MVTTNDRPLTRQTDQLLAEVAARVQLSPSRHRQATERYEAVADWLERDGSPLKGRVAQLYPQGSMSIGAAILSRKSNDRYDVDIASELILPQGISPKHVLDTLFQVVKGEPRSRYYDMTRRRSRCVTIEYSDMHVDLTPMVRRPDTPERESWIFENKKETPSVEKRLIANPHGFANGSMNRPIRSETRSRMPLGTSRSLMTWRMQIKNPFRSMRTWRTSLSPPSSCNSSSSGATCSIRV